MQPTSGIAIPQEFLKAPMVFVMNMVHQDLVARIIAIGSLAGLTSVLLVMLMATTRILYAMSRDNFLPSIFRKLNRKTRTPNLLTYTVAFISILGVLSLDLNAAAELCNYGAFTSFIIVCVAVLILRKVDPGRKRPFKVPFSPWFPLMGIFCLSGLMIYFLITSASIMSAILFPIWIGLSALIYFHYGYKKNRKKEAKMLEIKLKAIEKTRLKEQNNG